MEEILSSLNREQLEAVLYNDGPLLLLAGAGTGKTRVLTAKIAYIVGTNLSEASGILAVTFTNKAAEEMKRRVASMVSVDISEMLIGTLHSVSARILREYGDHMGLDRNFRIVDSSEQLSLVGRIMSDFAVDSQDGSPRRYSEMIGRIKNQECQIDDSLYGLAEIYEAYGQRLREMNGCDFNDLLIKVVELLSSCAEIRRHYGETLRYLLVDEYQDTNAIQHRWLKLISGVETNKNVKLTCVGDDDQSIYGWRGAEVNNMLRFADDYRMARVLKLERNYRSTRNILTVASTLIANNSYRHRKTIFTDSEDPGEKVQLVSCNDPKQEAIVIAREINGLRESGYVDDYGNICILVRASYQTRILEDVFLRYRLPYRIVGGIRFFERRELKNCIAYLRLIDDPDDFMALERIIGSSRMGLGSAMVLKIKDFANDNRVSCTVALSCLCSNGVIRGRSRDKVLDFVNRNSRWRSMAGSMSPRDLTVMILAETRLGESFDPDPESIVRRENLEELVNVLGDFSTLGSFLEYVSLMSQSENGDSSGRAVSLMTMHAAKGLEFDVVFLPNWQEGMFPTARSLEDSITLEEERRLAYVAITRARKKLYISYSKFMYENRGIVALRESRFIGELPRENLHLTACELDSQYYSDYYRRQHDC
jgi:DNA helicase-2/ATP-dependent DNA helicase PcrA